VSRSIASWQMAKLQTVHIVDLLLKFIVSKLVLLLAGKILILVANVDLITKNTFGSY
jgi:hypothetical protein